MKAYLHTESGKKLFCCPRKWTCLAVWMYY